MVYLYITDIHATKLESRVEGQWYRVIKIIGNSLVIFEDYSGYQMVRLRKHIIRLVYIKDSHNQS